MRSNVFGILLPYHNSYPRTECATTDVSPDSSNSVLESFVMFRHRSLAYAQIECAEVELVVFQFLQVPPHRFPSVPLCEVEADAVGLVEPRPQPDKPFGPPLGPLEVENGKSSAGP